MNNKKFLFLGIALCAAGAVALLLAFILTGCPRAAVEAFSRAW